ncbi:MAG: SWIM zinc finger family protein, partial [Lachnospiraceae bacterium]|nr:SWIM zinc finger family protein [Lachnospiraceae bacterium]
MISITEDLINMLAPNAAAIANGKKISKQGGFIKLYQSKDETYIGGECMGSGKKPYITSVDFFVPEAPVFRCTCPSRQFPCKHGLAIAFDYLAGKPF